MSVKAPTLRTQLVLAAGLIQLYSLGVGGSFWIQHRAHARLERTFQEGLAVLSSMPRLRDRLRALDQAGDQYLLTGQPIWLESREKALGQVRSSLNELASSLQDPRDAALAAEADHRLTAYLSERSPWISRRRAGRLSSDEAVRVARRTGGFDSVIEPLTALKDVNVAELGRLREETERASRRTLWLIILAGAGAAGFVAWFLARTLTGPVAALRERARGWKLGEAWDFPPPTGAGPEVADLQDTMGEMASRLNAQFKKEAELGKLKGRLVSMASHEFNNALSILGGTLYLLRQTETPPPEGRREEYYLVMETNLRGLSLATSNLLDLGRLESGRFAVRPGRADLGRVLNQAAQALQPIIERKRLDFALEIPPDAPPAFADPDALVMVAMNLLGNAVKYTPDGGRVRAGVEVMADGRSRVFVRDNGIGIAPEDRERVLQGFRTEAGSKAAKGFGVGLTLVRSVLEAHDAAISIEGSPGRGTEFSFFLPPWEGHPGAEELA